MIRGPAGTSVEITFRSGEAQHVISVKRANIVVPVTTRRMLAYDGRSLSSDGITPDIEAVDNPRTPVDEALEVAERTVVAEIR